MLRPHVPPIYDVNELPDVNTISEVTVVVDDVWRVGDYVAWLSEGCFWSGTITEIMDNDMVKGSQNRYVCARLILPLKQEGDTQNNKKATQGCSLELDESPTSQTSANSSPLPSRSNHPEDLLIQSEDVLLKKRQQMQSVDIAMNLGNSAMERPRADDSLSRTNVRDVLGEVPGVILSEELYHVDEFSKEMQVNETISINSPPCDSIEATVVELEEVVNRVRWLRQILKFGISSNFLEPTWKFLKHSTVSELK